MTQNAEDFVGSIEDDASTASKPLLGAACHGLG